MKIILNHQVQLKDFREGYVNIYKDFESDAIPHKGDFVADPCFKDPYEYEVTMVNIDYERNTCDVTLRSIVAGSNDSAILKNYVEMCEKHGWYCPTKDLL